MRTIDMDHERIVDKFNSVLNKLGYDTYLNNFMDKWRNILSPSYEHGYYPDCVGYKKGEKLVWIEIKNIKLSKLKFLISNDKISLVLIDPRVMKG